MHKAHSFRAVDSDQSSVSDCNYGLVLFTNLMYLFVAVLGLHCCRGFSLVVLSRGCSLVVVNGLLVEAASLVWSTGSRFTGFSSCSSWALEHRLSICGTRGQWLHSMWDPPRPGIESVFPAQSGRFFTTELPGKPYMHFLNGCFPLV